jgi:hypothetical protein
MSSIHKLATIAVASLALLTFSQSASALTGKCAVLINYPVTDFTTSGFQTLNILASLNFDTNTISYNVSFFGLPVSSQRNSWTATAVSDVPFTIAAGPISGSQTITFTRALISNGGYGYPAKTISWNVYPVNSGRTVLVQGQNDLSSGVCQF